MWNVSGGSEPIMSYTNYTNIAIHMGELVTVTQESLDRLAPKIASIDSELDSMVPTVHALSAMPCTRTQLNSFLLNTYNPAAFALGSCIAQKGGLEKKLELMRAAMLEPRYLADLVTQAEHCRIEEEEYRVIAEADAHKERLIAEATLSMDADFVKRRIISKSVHSYDCMERPCTLEDGSVVSVPVDTGCRNLTFHLFVPAIVLKRVTLPDMGPVCVVCHIDAYCDQEIIVRIVEEERILGQAKD
jgi:hypothetical protein